MQDKASQVLLGLRVVSVLHGMHSAAGMAPEATGWLDAAHLLHASK